ncbi:MAG TPA: tetratricopeptide repeat protein [Polyangia bacterium]|jgi:tetratricopeptide (TPR) repeat protein
MTRASARRVAVAAAALIASLASASATAGSSEKEREARAHFQAGETRFKAGQYEEALTEYQAGYDAKPLPGFLVNIGQCQRRLGDLKAARATYQKFVLVAPDSPLVPQVKSMMAEIDGLLASSEKSKPAPEEDARPEPAAAATASATAVPPAPKPEAEAAAPVLVAPARETGDAPAAAPKKKSHRWWLWAALGAVVVGGAVTAYALTSGGTTTIHDGSIDTLRR